MHVGLVTRGEVAYVLDLANQLHEVGVSVSLYMCREHTVVEAGTAEGPVERLYDMGLLPRACRVRLVQLPRMMNPWSSEVMRELGKRIRSEGADVVHLMVGSSEPWLCVLAGMLTRHLPVVATMTQPIRDIGERHSFIVEWLFLNLLVRAADFVIVNGIDQPELVQKLYDIPGGRVAYVPLSPRVTAMRWANAGVVEEPATILFFGRAVPHKGLEFLVRAEARIARAIEGVRFLIVAHGSDLDRCRGLIQEDGLFEVHDGFVSGSDMAMYFQRSAIVVLPYLCSTSSGVLMTAYAFGKPVVASDVSGLSEYVEDGITGRLVPPADVSRLSDAIIGLLQDERARKGMGEGAKRWVERTQQDVVKDTLKAYEGALERVGRQKRRS
jgi:glycosyltransferase involved in cell wall biosynthesis